MRLASVVLSLIILLVVAGTPVSTAATAIGGSRSCAATTRTGGIQSVPVGEPLIVGGQTNLQPDDNVIFVELRSSDGEVVATNDTEEWNRDGVWCVRLQTTDLHPGTYMVEVDDGHNTITETVRLVQSTPTPTETPSLTARLTPTPTESPTATPTQPTTPMSTTTPSSTTGTGAGLGVSGVVAPLALAVTIRMIWRG